LACGLALAPWGEAGAEAKDPYERLNVFARVMSYIERSYVDPPDQSKLVEAAIKGMVSSLDENSAYFTPEEYAELRKEAEGLFVGVGLELGTHEGQIVVVAPIEGAPAERAGVRPGDVLRSLDGKAARGWTLREAIRRVQGAEGSEVVVEVMRGGPQGELHRFALKREPLEVDAVVSKPLGGGLAYVRVRFFQDGVATEVKGALEELEGQGEVKGVVLDLRNNPGGLLIEGVKLSDLFLKEGVIVKTQGRDRGQNQEFRAEGPGTIFAGPVVVLVNGGTASASEIVAGAFRDHGRGLLVGEKTYGKGSVQSIIDLKGGAGLKLTTARYYAPKGGSIQGTGFVPDVVVGPTTSQEVGEGWYKGDAPLTKAVELLRTGQHTTEDQESEK
jgi:carboxyl-terminal processing protease